MSSFPRPTVRAPDCRPANASSSGFGERRGPPHCERRATTSANMVRSAKAILGCDLSCAQAVLQGTVSLPLDTCSGEEAADLESAIETLGLPRLGFDPAPPHIDGPLPHPPHPRKLELEVDPEEEHVVHCFTELPNAAQKAFPNGSSAQAKQFDGSPVQLGESESDERMD